MLNHQTKIKDFALLFVENVGNYTILKHVYVRNIHNRSEQIFETQLTRQNYINLYQQLIGNQLMYFKKNT